MHALTDPPPRMALRSLVDSDEDWGDTPSPSAALPDSAEDDALVVVAARNRTPPPQIRRKPLDAPPPVDRKKKVAKLKPEAASGKHKVVRLAFMAMDAERREQLVDEFLLRDDSSKKNKHSAKKKLAF